MLQKNKSYKEVTVNINVDGEAFTAKSQKIIDAGFTAFLKGTDLTDTENKNADVEDNLNESGIFELLKDLKQGLVGNM